MKFQLRILLCCLALQAGLPLCLAHDNKTVHPKVYVIRLNTALIRPVHDI
jgi:hypothetical protein